MSIKMNNRQLDEKHLIDCISKFNNNPEILEFLKENSISIEKVEPPFGLFRSEHLIKAMNLADFFNVNELISEVPLLQNFYLAIAKNTQNKRTFNHKSYMDFFKSKYPDLTLSDSSWQQVTNKIDLETFIGIDDICEKAILIWNSLPKLKTINSCSGHYNANRYFSFSNFQIEFVEDNINSIAIANSFKSAFSSFDSDIFKIDIDLNKNRLGVRFFQIPSPKWIEENSKISIIELCNDTFNQLKTTFNIDEDFETFNLKNYSSTIEAVEFVRKNTWKCVNQMNANLNIDDTEDDYFWTIFRKRCLIFEETYKDFYISKDAINNIKLFWGKIENLGIELQKIMPMTG